MHHSECWVLSGFWGGFCGGSGRFKALLGPILESSRLPNPVKIQPKLDLNPLLAPKCVPSSIFMPLGPPNLGGLGAPKLPKWSQINPNGSPNESQMAPQSTKNRSKNWRVIFQWFLIEFSWLWPPKIKPKSKLFAIFQKISILQKSCSHWGAS